MWTLSDLCPYNIIIQAHTDLELLIRLEQNKPKSGCPDLQTQHWCCVVLCGAV